MGLDGDRRRKPCFQLWNMFMIARDGKVTPCCKDRFLELAIGDLNKDSLSEVLYGHKIQEMRMDHIKGKFHKYKMCAECKDPPGGFLTDSEIKLYMQKYNLISIPRKEKRLLNICLVSREYPDETGWGGIGTYTHHLAHAMAERGHQVHVVSQGLEKEQDYKDGHVHVHRITHENYFNTRLIFEEFMLRLEYSKSVSRKLKEVVDGYNIDIIEGPNLSAETFFYSFNRRIPIVTRLHTNFSGVLNFAGNNRGLDNRLSCWLEDSSIQRSDLIICSTKAHADKIADETGIMPDRIKIIPLGVELPENTDPGYRDARPRRVLFVGRLEERKGPQVLVRAIPLVLRAIADAEFIFIGRDTFNAPNGTDVINTYGRSYKNYLIKNIPESCRPNVNFLGHVSNEGLSEYFKSSAVFVGPSLYESFGFIYIEAMSYGKPVIGCGVGGVPEVIKDGKTGILVPPDDHVSLANAIIDLLENEKRRRIMGIAAREDVENNFSRELMAERTEEAYLSLLK